ncbi:MAG: cytochrome c oxidase subunit 3 [Halobacteriota archaeon]
MSVGDSETVDGSSSEPHLPAPDDWPRAFGEASWWPFVAALGAAAIYTGFGLWLVFLQGWAALPEMAGAAVIVLGVVVFIGGLYGWLYQAFIAHFWNRPGDAAKFRWGMILFLATEVATFGTGFIYYFFIRVGPWPPGELPHLLTSLVAANTVILITSSFTLHFAHTALRDGNRQRFRTLLGATVVLGVVFLAGQAYEYFQFVVTEGFGLASGPFYSAFFGLTGLHGLHVLLGVVLLLILFIRGIAGQFSAERHTSVATVTMYWHFVDAVWIFLVTTLYVGAVV